MLKPLHKMTKVIEEFRKLDPEMQAQQMQTFLMIASQPGELSIKEIAERLGMAQSTASRCVSYWSKMHRLRRQGHDMVVAAEDMMNRSRKLVSLNNRGKKFAADLTEAVER
jgi:DNA-binding MarR family transcriptional regulator